MESNVTVFPFTAPSIADLEENVNKFIRAESITKDKLSHPPQLNLSNGVAVVSLAVMKDSFETEDTIRIRMFSGSFQDIENQINMLIRKEGLTNRYIINYDIGYMDEQYVGMISFFRVNKVVR